MPYDNFFDAAAYKPTAPVPVPVRNVGAAPPAVYPDVSAIIKQDILDSPQYKSAIENVNLNRDSGQATLDFNKLTGEQNYQNSLSQIGAGDALAAQRDALQLSQGAQTLASQQANAALQLGSADYNLQAGKDAAALQLGTATHTRDSQIQEAAIRQAADERAFAQNQKYTREALGSRGNAGGQLGFEIGNLQSAWGTAQQQKALTAEGQQFTFDQFAKAQGLDAANANFSYDQFVKAQGLDAGNAEFAYNLLMKEINVGAQGRALENQINTTNLNLNYSQQQGQQTLNQANLNRDTAVNRGTALTNTESQLMTLWWDAATGTYRGPSGQQITLAQAQASINATPPPTGQWLQPNVNPWDVVAPPGQKTNAQQFADLDAMFGG
jgi:hypothetical protein